jgi:hypothetical protein
LIAARQDQPNTVAREMSCHAGRSERGEKNQANKIADLQSHGDQNYRQHHAPETITECGNTDYRQNSCGKRTNIEKPD